MEQRYGITIEKVKALKSIPISCLEYGQPFISKQVSEYMYRLQKHHFQWENDTFENLHQKYPKCKSALMWWTNQKGNMQGKISRFDIAYNKYLKEFIITNPPNFRISNKWCEYAKKKASHLYSQLNNCDLDIVGIRKAEGGARAGSYKNCFTNNTEDISHYRPLFWFTNEDKKVYDRLFNVVHSDCYNLYGLKRTGCVGCPFGRDLEDEIEIMKKYEPKLAKAANNIFKDSYEYTKKYRQFAAYMKANKGGDSIAKND